MKKAESENKFGSQVFRNLALAVMNQDDLASITPVNSNDSLAGLDLLNDDEMNVDNSKLSLELETICIAILRLQNTIKETEDLLRNIDHLLKNYKDNNDLFEINLTIQKNYYNHLLLEKLLQEKETILKKNPTLFT